jgi:hypothetical protein
MVAPTAVLAVCGFCPHARKEPRTSNPEDRATCFCLLAAQFADVLRADSHG